MHRILAFAIASLVLVASASAGSYTLNTNAQQDARLERARLAFVKAECARVDLGATCTQAEADAAAAARGVTAPDVPATVALFVRTLLVRELQEIGRGQDDEDRTVCLAVASAPGSNWSEVCKLLGLAPNCAKPSACTP